MSTISPIIFARRFAKKADITLKEAKPIVAMIEEEITRALVGGREVRLAGLGIFKKVRFRSQMMANPNNRSQRRLVLDRYYMRFKASDVLKDKIKTILHPGYQPRTKTVKERGIKGSLFSLSGVQRTAAIPKTTPIENNGIPIKISVKPRIPPLKWREPMSALYLDLARRHLTPTERLVKNVIRWIATDQAHGISLAPHQFINYEKNKQINSPQLLVYESFIKTLKTRLPQIFREPKTWRVMINLPPRVVINLSASPCSQHEWILNLQKPHASIDKEEAEEIMLPTLVSKKLDTIFDRGYGRIAIVGPRYSRLAAVKLLQKILIDGSIGHHYIVEHHHYPPHDHHSLKPNLRELFKETKAHPVLLIESLSGADNLEHLQEFKGVVVAGMTLGNRDRLISTLNYQHLKPEFFDIIFESYSVLSACEECPPLMKSAVLFPPLRKMAAVHNDRLDESQVLLSCPDCDHPQKHTAILTTYAPTTILGSNLKDQLYQLVLENKITYNTFEEML